MPFFSIVIPTYNRAHLIGKTINAVLSQEYKDFELIIVDDGSTDETRQIIEAFTDDRIVYIYQENGERGKSRNNGVNTAKGEYIFFLDSDDLIYPEHLQHAYTEIQKIGIPEFFSSRYEAIYETRSVQLPQLNASTIQHKIKKQNVFACQFFLKREVALAFPFSENRDLKIGEDWEVILKVAARYQLNISNKVTAAIVHHGERSMEIATAAVILTSRDILMSNLTADQKITADIIANVYSEFTTLAALSAAIQKQKLKQ